MIKIANAMDANDTCLKIISQYHEKACMVQNVIDKGKTTILEVKQDVFHGKTDLLIWTDREHL